MGTIIKDKKFVELVNQAPNTGLDSLKSYGEFTQYKNQLHEIGKQQREFADNYKANKEAKKKEKKDNRKALIYDATYGGLAMFNQGIAEAYDFIFAPWVNAGFNLTKKAVTSVSDATANVMKHFTNNNDTKAKIDKNNENFKNKINNSENVAQNISDYYKNEGERMQQKTAQDVAKTPNKIDDIIVPFTQQIVRMIPDTVMMIMSAGSTAAAGVANTVSKGLSMPKSMQYVQSLIKNPMFWNTFGTEGGSAYATAKKAGASEAKAVTAGMLVGTVNGAIEVGGGVETWLTSPKKTSFTKEMVKSMLEEGGEEVRQDFMTNVTAKMLYEPDKEWFSTTNEDAIVNPAQMGKTFATAAALAFVMNSAQSGAMKGINTAKITQTGRSVRDIKEEVISSGLDFDRNSDAFKNALSLVNKKKVSNYELGQQHLLNIEQMLKTEQVLPQYKIGYKTNENNQAVSDNNTVDNTSSNVSDFATTIDQSLINTTDNSSKTNITDSELNSGINDNQLNNIENQINDTKNETKPSENQMNDIQHQTNNELKSQETDNTSLNNNLSEDAFNLNETNNAELPPHKGIAMTKVGDFYEAYGENAEWLAEKLDLHLTQKTINGKQISMVGFPISNVKRYADLLGFDIAERKTNDWEGVLLKPIENKETSADNASGNKQNNISIVSEDEILNRDLNNNGSSDMIDNSISDMSDTVPIDNETQISDEDTDANNKEDRIEYDDKNKFINYLKKHIGDEISVTDDSGKNYSANIKSVDKNWIKIERPNGAVKMTRTDSVIPTKNGWETRNYLDEEKTSYTTVKYDVVNFANENSKAKDNSNVSTNDNNIKPKSNENINNLRSEDNLNTAETTVENTNNIAKNNGSLSNKADKSGNVNSDNQKNLVKEAGTKSTVDSIPNETPKTTSSDKKPAKSTVKTQSKTTKIKRAKKSDWNSHDVVWYAPNSNTTIAYSTIAAKELVDMLADDNPNMTISELQNTITYDVEAKKVLQAYIDIGFENEIASKYFGDMFKSKKDIMAEENSKSKTKNNETNSKTPQTDTESDLKGKRKANEEYNKPDNTTVVEKGADNGNNKILDNESKRNDGGIQPKTDSETKKRKETTKDTGTDSTNSADNISGDTEQPDSKQTAAKQNPSRDNNNKLRKSDNSKGNDGRNDNVFDKNSVKSKQKTVKSSEKNGTETKESDTVAKKTDEKIKTEQKSETKTKPKNNSNNYTVPKTIDDINPNFNDNYKAIQLLKELENSGKPATKAQKEILSKYKGWGGLANVFNENVWNPNNKLLKELLTEQEYKAARSTINDAYYTPTSVIDVIYKGIRRLGFTGGNVLEPSMGIGNFYGRMPKAFLEKSNLYGVEIDPITARIAKYLYPDADILIQGFQDVPYKDGSFDLAIGNVPFSEITYKYKNGKYSLHDYFFIKTLDKMSDGGIVAFLTSTGTLDKATTKARNEIMSRANLIAAYRLPGGVFKTNAGTGVTTDIIILQKRGKNETQTGESIENIGTIDGIPINEYYVKHPENIIGEVTTGTNQYGKEVLQIKQSGDYIAQLTKAMSKLPKDLVKGKTSLEPIKVEMTSDQKPHFTEQNGRVMFVDGATKEVVEYTGKRAERIKGFLRVKQAYNNLIDASVNGQPKDITEPLRQELNTIYDDFVKKNKEISYSANKFMSDDVDYIKLTGLEIYDPNTKKYSKSEIFFKDTLTQNKIEHTDSSTDALAISVNETGDVDLKLIEKLTGKNEEEIVNDLSDTIIRTPDGNYELLAVYLSGNIVEKIKEVEGKKGFERNLELLKKVLPTQKTAVEITPQFGATWIDEKYISQFLKETLDLNHAPKVTLNKVTGEWEISKEGYWGNPTLLNNKYGTNRANAIELAQQALNYKVVTIKDKIDSNTTKINTKETKIAREKQNAIKEEFSRWIFKDKDRRDTLVTKYNELYNNYKNMDYAELSKYLTFPNMSPTFKLRDYQKAAVARVVFGGNTLLAHGVGTGKTAEMIASAMELKRMGISNKNLMIVPKHKIGDFRSDILKMYPNAKVLMATENDFKPINRKKLLNKIKTNDWDIVIIGHSSFTLMPAQNTTEAEYIQKEIDLIEETLKATADDNARSQSRTLRNLEKSKKNLENNLKELLDVKRDDGITFEELGINTIFVDEAHNFKNLKNYTKLNIAGVGKSNAKRASDLFMKINYLNSKNGRVVFATATPITNTVSEMYTMMRYLKPDLLESTGLNSFDAWAKTFGSIETKIEMSPDGRSFRTKERFSKFSNVREMIGMFRQVADVLKTGDVVKDLPKARRVDVISPSTDIHKQYLDIISKRINTMSNSKQDKSDNMLLVTNDGRAMATDLRLVASQLEGYDIADLDVPESRINQAVNNIVKEYKQSNDRKGTQFVFLDFGMSDNPENRYNFNLYNDLINKLVDAGIPANEIAKINDYETVAKKDELFAQMNNGTKRVLIGSTARMGEGMNAQKKSVALHHLNVPYRPSDLEQREGRIIRFGNENKNVTIYRYIQEESFDSYMWQMQERKAGFINQAMSDGNVNEIQETDEFVLSAKEGMAIASGNPLLIEKVNVDEEVNTLRMLQKNHEANLYEMQDRLDKLPGIIEKQQSILKELKNDSEIAEQKPDSFSIIIEHNKKKNTYSERKDAAEALEKVIKNAPKNGKQIKIGEYRNFDIYYSESITDGRKFVIKHDGEYIVDAGTSAIGNITRISNKIDSIPKQRDNTISRIKSLENEIKTIEEEIVLDFPKQDELDEALKRQANLIEQLGMNEIDNADIIEDMNDDFKTEEELEEEAREKEENGDYSYYYDYGSSDSKTPSYNQWVSDNKETEDVINKADHKITGLTDIVNYLSKTFELPVSTGNYRMRALGVYKELPQTIRVKITNNIPVITHELGHHLDAKYKFSKSKNIDEVKTWVNKKSPGFLDNYDDNVVPKECVAEFIREFYRDRNAAKNDMPKFYDEFLTKLSAEDRAAVLKTSNLVSKYFKSGFKERVEKAVITRKEAKTLDKTTVQEKTRKIYTKLIDDYMPIKDAVDFVETTTDTVLPGNKNAYKLALHSKNANSISHFILKEGIVNINGTIQKNSNGTIQKSFIDSISMVKSSNLNDFSNYLILKHSLSWIAPTEGTSKRVFADETLQDVEKITQEIENYERAHPEYKEAANNLYTYQRRVMKTWLVDTGIMSESLFNKLQEKYPHYVPLKRAVGKNTKKAAYNFANQRLPIERAKGSGAMILNPLESIIENTERFVKVALRNKTMQAMANYADKTEGFGAIMERVAPDMVKNTINIEDKLDQLKEIMYQNGIINSKNMSMFDEMLDDVLGTNVESYTPVVRKDKSIVTVLRGGKATYYQVHDKDLFDALANLSPKQLSYMQRVSRKILMPLQLTITQFNHVFGLRNPIRDYSTAMLNTEAFNNPISFSVAYVQALKHIITDSSEYKAYKAAGGGHNSDFSAKISSIERTLNDLASKDMGKARRLTYALLHNKVQTLVKFNEIAETIPRLVEFTGLKEKGEDAISAMYAADDITVNFNRSGTIGRELNSIFMFSNAQLQGMDKTIRTLSSGGTKKALKYTSRYLMYNALMAIIVETIARIVDPDDWEQLSNYNKNNNWCIALGDGKYIKIPKAREASLLSSLIERVIDKMFGDDEAFYQFGEYLTDTIIPSFIPTDLIKGDIKGGFNQLAGSTIIGGFAEIATNQDYKGTPIRSTYLEDLPNKEQVTANTSWLAYKMGQMLNIPPVYIDHFINEFGVFGKLNQTFKMDPSRNDLSFGIKSSFTADSTYSQDVFNAMYDMRDKYNDKYRNNPTAQNAAMAERYSLMTSFISNGKKTFTGQTGDDARKSTRKLIEATKKFAKTSTVDKQIVSSLGNKAGNYDYFKTSLPNNELKKTVKGESYTYNLSLDEYIKYINEYMSLLNEERSDLLKSKEYRKADTDTRVEMLKSINFSDNEALKDWKSSWVDKYVKTKKTK